MKKIQKRRRKERKTDYKKRIGLLKSGVPRIVFRKTNKQILSQYILSEEAKDKVVFGVVSNDLLKHGWPKEFSGSLKSIPASYLTGFLVGKTIQKKKLETPIIDTGMTRIIKKNRFFAFLKGLKDSGVEIECDEKNFPEEEKIKGKNLKKDFSSEFEKIKLNLEKI
jgi:large subunit ribosomal protein L18